jgi:hypothetical protein
MDPRGEEADRDTINDAGRGILIYSSEFVGYSRFDFAVLDVIIVSLCLARLGLGNHPSIFLTYCILMELNAEMPEVQRLCRTPRLPTTPVTSQTVPDWR